MIVRLSDRYPVVHLGTGWHVFVNGSGLPALYQTAGARDSLGLTVAEQKVLEGLVGDRVDVPLRLALAGLVRLWKDRENKSALDARGAWALRDSLDFLAGLLDKDPVVTSERV